MIEVSKSQPIYWHHGMFLQPHHFQQSELFAQSQIDIIKQNVSPWLWGFINLELSSASISSKHIEINEAELIFEDGTYAKINDNAYLASRSLEGIEIDPERPLTAYIALRKMSSFNANVSKIQDTSEASSVNSRFFTFHTPNEISDLYSKGDAALAHELTLKLEIVFESEKEDFTDYSLMPFAKIVLDGENLAMLTNYTPPAINVSSSKFLTSQLKDLKDELTGRAIQLKSGQSMLGNNALDNNALRYRMSLQALSRFVPKLAHEVNTKQMHPWGIYGGLCELIGEISTFTQDINLLGENTNGDLLLPEYTHLNISECFTSARQLINQLLNDISVGPQFLVEMNREQQSFKSEIPTEFFEERADFYLILNSEESWDSYSQSFFTSAKLAAHNTIDVLIERSLPGIGLIHSPVIPAGLPKKDNANYIRIDTHDDEWLTIQRQNNISLHWDEAPQDLKIELVILKR
jgi:type VI secretion system protein ImpJ